MSWRLLARALGIVRRAARAVVTRRTASYALLLLAGALVVAGFALIHPAAGLICAGLALLAVLTFDADRAWRLTWPR